jgi:catechol 2,3-dioxygenase-like lactoylglutathione lyase family enzyme
MKFGYTIIYVRNVAASLEFFHSAFGLKTRYLHESGAYGELETGETRLAFASHEMGASNLPAGYVAIDSSATPLGIEIAIVTDEVDQAHKQAVTCGATSLKEPEVKPWGQTVSYVRCPDGLLVELCSPITV